GTYFFDYGMAFLLVASRAGADVMNPNPTLGREFQYPSYVQDIMGPMCFDYGVGPFRWVCASNNPEDLQKTDDIACEVLEEMIKTSPEEIQQPIKAHSQSVRAARANTLVLAS